MGWKIRGRKKKGGRRKWRIRLMEKEIRSTGLGYI